MDKIKNLLNPGSKKDDEVMYGSGKSDDPVHTGQHHGSSHPLTSNTTGDDSGPASAFSGYGNTPVPGGNRADVDKPYYEGTQSSTTTTTGTTSHPTDPSSTSRMPGTFDDDANTTASVKSGVVGEPQQGSALTGSDTVGSSTNRSLPLEPESAGTGRTGPSGVGPHDSSLLNKADPRVDSDLDGSRGLDTGATGGGLTGSSLPDRSVGSSGYGNDQTPGSTNLGQGIGGDSGRSFPLSGSSATGTASSTNEPVLGSTSSGIGSGTGPTTGSSHQGDLARDVPLAGAYNEESWKHDHSAKGHEYGGDPCSGPDAPSGGPHFTKGPHALDTANRLDPHVAGGGPIESIATTNTGITTGADVGSSTTDTGLSSTSGPGLGSSSSNDHHLGRDAGLAGGAGAAGLGGYQSSRDGSSTTTTGPHSSDLLNKADPRVDSDASGQQNTSSVGAGSGISGSSSTTAGPHSSNLANKADSRVDSDLSGNRGETTVGPASGVVGSSADGTALPSDNLGSGQTAGRDHHTGRDAGLVGAGAAGFGAYEAGKHHDTPGATSSAATSDPNKSADYDPRIDSTPSARTGLGGTSSISPTTRSETADTTGRDHHVGRDAGLAGSGGLAAYEGQKHLGGSTAESSQPTQSSTSASPATGALYDSGNGPTTGIEPKPATTETREPESGHHYGRDAAIGAGAAGLAGTAYEAQKRHGEPTSTTSSSAYDTREPTSTTGTSAYDTSKPTADTRSGAYDTREPTSTTGTSAYDTSKTTADSRSGAYDTREPTQSHPGRDAALAGGAGIGAGALAGEELSQKDLKHQQHELEKEQKAHQKELEKEQKAHQKELEKEHKAEQKAHDKEVAHEQKHHQHELEKAEKARQHEAEKAEKARLHEAEKAEKAHQKELEKAEKKHEKEVSKEEKDPHEKKKHGGLLGLFHREKPDDELKKEELQRRGEYVEPDISRDGAAGSIQNPELTHAPRDTTTTGTQDPNLSNFEQEKRAGEYDGMSEAEKLQHARQHDRNRLHKDPPPGYIEKKMEEQGGAGGRETLPDGRVVEPHTGLPMDLSKDASGGAGGTDGTPVGGYHAH